MRCPECNARLILQAFWQGHYVNCTSCGAKLERGWFGIIASYAAALVTWVIADYLLTESGAVMEVEIPVSLLAMAAGYLAVHTLTLRLKPREDEPSLRI